MKSSSGSWLEIETWSRRAHFEFFSGYASPTFNLCSWVPAGATREACRAHGASFSLAVWFAVQRAIDACEPFRYRLRAGRVWIHDRVHVATTVLDPDGATFRFVHFPWAASFDAFVAGARRAIDAARETEVVGDLPDDDAVVHGSTVPWIAFTSVTHARQTLESTDADSIPRIVIGRYHDVEGEGRLPISVEAHHALVDGLHMGELLESLSNVLSTPHDLWVEP